MVTYKEARMEYDVFRKNLKYYRHKLQMTQEMLAERSDLSTSYIKQIESVKSLKIFP